MEMKKLMMGTLVSASQLLLVRGGGNEYGNQETQL